MLDAKTLQHLQELQRQEEERLLAELQADRERLPAEARLWLALTPFWTPRLATLAGFPVDGTSTIEVLDRMHDLGLCGRESSAPEVTVADGRATLVPSEPTYSMPDRQRRVEIADAVAARGTAAVADVLADVARGLLAASPPEHLRRWAEIACEAGNFDALRQRLDARVEPLLRDGRLSAARRWVGVARLIPRLWDGRFAAAVAAHGRQIELAHRRVDDRARLADFIERREQIRAIEALLLDKQAWAIHFVGVAGVGKTTLVRRLVDAEEQLGFISARVDFDFLTLDYPLSKPVELLDRFADELRLHDPSGVAAKEFELFDEHVAKLNAGRRAALAGEVRTVARKGTTAAAAIVGEDDLQRIIEAFARAISVLPRRVLLVLDTCEELARLRPDGSAPASVEVTFDLLERVHHEVEKARVVFCGRRPLASAGGHGEWSAPGSQHARRDYLRLHEVRGFLKPQAKAYLKHMGVPEELREPILRRAGATDKRQRFDYRDAGAGPVLGQRRYNPFELGLYGRWAADPENPPTLEQIRDPRSDPYIAVRLVGRLQDAALRDLLAVVAILGRFDRDLLSAVAGIPPERFDAIFGWLIGAEWIDTQTGGWFEVQRPLRPRLLCYLREHEPASLSAARNRLQTQLRAYIANRRLDELDASHLSAMARLFTSPDEASAWWRELEQRFVATRDWQRAHDLAGILLQEGDPECAGAPAVSLDPLVGPVRATYAATMRHVAPAADAATEWVAVEAWVGAHPETDSARVLRLRAVAGRVSGAPTGARVDWLAALGRLADAVAALDPELLDAELAAACVAALERIVEAATPDFPGLERCEALLATVADHADPGPLAAFTHALLARVRLLARRPDQAWADFMAAVAHEPPRRCRDQWLDWRAPDDIGAAVRSAFLGAGFPPDRVLAVLEEPHKGLVGTYEGRYLLSALLQARMDVVWVTPDEAERWHETYSTGIVDASARPVHGILPPLEVTLYRALQVSGRIQTALDGYVEMLGRANRDQAHAIVRGLNQLLLVQHRRLRLRDERIGAASVGRQAPGETEQRLLWALDGLDGAKAVSLFAPGRPSERPRHGYDWPAWRHARWRSVYAGSDSRKRDAVTWAAIALAHERQTAAQGSEHVLACALDGLEANALAAQIGYPPPCRMTFGAAEVAQALALRSVGRGQTAFRLLLRHWALTEDVGSAAEAERLAAEIGVRRAGLIALDEATLLALRLPAAAVGPLACAVRWLEAAGDVVHGLLATVTAALAAVRSGGKVDPSPWIERIEPAYRALAARGAAQLPAWEQVAGPQAQATLDGLASPLWRPWLARIAALEAYRQRDVAAVAAWVVEHYGGRGAALAATTELAASGPDEAGVPVPAEFDGWLGTVAPLSIAPPVRSRVGSALRDAVALGAGATIWLAFVAGAWKAVDAAPWGGWFALAGFVLIALVACVALVRRWLLGRSTFVIDIQPYEPISSEVAPYETSFAVRLSGTRRRVFERFGGRPVTDVSLAAVVRVARDRPVSGPPAELAELLATLKRLAAKTGRRLDVPLVIAPTAAWVPWEALLALAFAPDARTAADVPLRLRRVPLRTRPPWGESDDRRKVLTLAAGIPEANLARAWRSAGVDHTCRRISDRTGLRFGPSWNVLHIAARFAESASGVVLETGGVPLRSSDIASRFSQLELCVLQGVTVPQPRMTSWERNQAGLMRTFAAELADFGVPAVLTLPPMDRESGQRALTAVTTNVTGRRVFSVKCFKDTLQASRVAITHEPGRPQLEKALEACLYAAGESRWFYRLMALIALDPILASHIPAEEAHDPHRTAGQPVQPRFAALPLRAHPR